MSLKSQKDLETVENVNVSKMCRPPRVCENAHSAFVGRPNVAKVDMGGEAVCHNALSFDGTMLPSHESPPSMPR